MEPPVNRPAYPGSAEKQGVSIRKKGTHRPEVLWTLRIGEIFGFWIGQAGIAGRGSSALVELLPPPRTGSRLCVSRGCGKRLRLSRGNPRMRSPRPRFHRLRACFTHIGLRSGATGPRRFGGRFDLRLYICCSGFSCRRGRCCHGFSTQAKLLRQSGALLRIGRGRKRMVAPQTPALPIFIPGQAVAHADMAAERLAPVAAIQADHPILTHRSPHRYRRSQRHLGRIGPFSLSQGSMYGSDQIRKLTCADSMMPKVTSNDFRGKMWIRALGIHGSLQTCSL